MHLFDESHMPRKSSVSARRRVRFENLKSDTRPKPHTHTHTPFGDDGTRPQLHTQKPFLLANYYELKNYTRGATRPGKARQGRKSNLHKTCVCTYINVLLMSVRTCVWVSVCGGVCALLSVYVCVCVILKGTHTHTHTARRAALSKKIC